MSLRKKTIKFPEDDAVIEKVISKGGHVSSDLQKKNKQWTTLCLKITRDLLKDVDHAVEERIGMNRTAWILEAVQDKLKRWD